jgi:hypothetical protein
MSPSTHEEKAQVKCWCFASSCDVPPAIDVGGRDTTLLLHSDASREAGTTLQPGVRLLVRTYFFQTAMDRKCGAYGRIHLHEVDLVSRPELEASCTWPTYRHGSVT